MMEAGVHFGHQTKRWNPKMKPYIFGARNGIHIIDLQKTVARPQLASSSSARRRPRRLGPVRRHQEAGPGRRCAKRPALPAVLRHQALAGRHAHQLQDHQAGIDRLHDHREDGGRRHFERLPKKEVAALDTEREKLQKNLGGIKEMPAARRHLHHRPDKEHIAVHEARKLEHPHRRAWATPTAIPDLHRLPDPGQRRRPRAIKLFCGRVADAVRAGGTRRPRAADQQRTRATRAARAGDEPRGAGRRRSAVEVDPRRRAAAPPPRPPRRPREERETRLTSTTALHRGTHSTRERRDSSWLKLPHDDQGSAREERARGWRTASARSSESERRD